MDWPSWHVSLLAFLNVVQHGIFEIQEWAFEGVVGDLELGNLKLILGNLVIGRQY